MASGYYYMASGYHRGICYGYHLLSKKKKSVKGLFFFCPVEKDTYRGWAKHISILLICLTEATSALTHRPTEMMAMALSAVITHPVFLRKFWEGDLLTCQRVNSTVLWAASAKHCLCTFIMFLSEVLHKLLFCVGLTFSNSRFSSVWDKMRKCVVTLLDPLPLYGGESESRQPAPMPRMPIKILNEKLVTGLTSLCGKPPKFNLVRLIFGCNKPAVTSCLKPLMMYMSTDKITPDSHEKWGALNEGLLSVLPAFCFSFSQEIYSALILCRCEC